jgi:general secretion pathway protein D
MKMFRSVIAVGLGASVLLAAGDKALYAQSTAALTIPQDTVHLQFVDADLSAVVQVMGRHLGKPVITSGIPDTRVTFETPGYIRKAELRPLLEGLVETHGLKLTEESSFFRVTPLGNSTPAPAQASSGGSGDVQLFVVHLKHARAADVAATLNQLFGGSGGSMDAGLSTGTLSDELRRTGLPSQASNGTQPAATVPGAGGLSGPLIIVPDPLTNTLLMRVSQHDHDLLSAAIDQLDTRPLQVLIEVLIVEARRDRSFSLGADLDLAPQDIGHGGTAEGTVSGAGLGDVVVKFMNLAKGRVDAILSLAESRGDVKIVSRPVLLASNNVEARFLVGSQRPFVQVSRSLPTDTPSRDQVIQYRDVGTKLTVRPTINDDGYVSLVVQQEINAATTETQFDAPVISTREAATQVLVRDGQTIVLGGLRDNQRDRSRHGIPILSSIPVLGGLFGGQTERETSTELFIFLTPRILRTDADADAITTPRLPASERPDTAASTP